MPPMTGDELVRAQLGSAQSGQINTSAYPYKLLRALNSTKLAGKEYYDGNGGDNVVFGGTGWGNTGPVTYVAPDHHGLGPGAVVGIVAAAGFVLVVGGAIAVIRYRKRHAKHGGGGQGGPGFIEKWRAKILGDKGHEGDEEKAGSAMGTVAPGPDHYASRSRGRSRSTYVVESVSPAVKLVAAAKALAGVRSMVVVA
ncbi:MAG: hypothetical protein Q9195_004804 [Heterodermia aff. obscurata]